MLMTLINCKMPKKCTVHYGTLFTLNYFTYKCLNVLFTLCSLDIFTDLPYIITIKGLYFSQYINDSLTLHLTKHLYSLAVVGNAP